MTFWKFGLMTCIFNKNIHDNYSTQTYPDGIIHPPAVLTVDHRSTTKPTGRTLVLGRRLLPPNELETWLRDFDNAQQPGFPDVWFSLGVQKNLELRWVENPFLIVFLFIGFFRSFFPQNVFAKIFDDTFMSVLFWGGRFLVLGPRCCVLTALAESVGLQGLGRPHYVWRICKARVVKEWTDIDLCAIMCSWGM